jgi:hypothetical protein
MKNSIIRWDSNPKVEVIIKGSYIESVELSAGEGERKQDPSGKTDKRPMLPLEYRCR